MGENPRFLVAFGILVLASCLIAVGLVVQTIALHPDAAGFLSIVTPVHAEPSPARPVIHITDDPGGSIADYYRKYEALSNAGAEIHFHGMCESACTMVLFTEFTGIKACADEGATFAFHKPFAQQNGKVMRTKAAIRASRKIWAAWLKELPNPLRKYLSLVRVPSAAEGDEMNTLLLIPGGLLLPRCPMSVASQ